MHNVSVAGKLWLGGQPSTADLELAKRRGIETVIDLCTGDSTQRDPLAEKCRELDMQLLKVPLSGNDQIAEGTVDVVLDTLRDANEHSTLMFCDTGGNSAMFFAIHRVLEQNVDVEEALLEARRAGMKPGEPEEFVLRQIERLTGWELVEGDDIAEAPSDSGS